MVKNTIFSQKKGIFTFFTKLYLRQFYITRKLKLHGAFVDKDPDPDPVFSQIWIRENQKDRMRIRNTVM